MNLNFVSPVYLLGLLGIGLPILVHLLTRRQQTHLKFSAVHLLLQSEKRSVKRSKPNRLLLLLFRCLAIACLSMALANPIFSLGLSDEFLSPAPSANVFIIDDSYSMGSRTEDKTLYAESLEGFKEILMKISPQSSFSLVAASSPGRILQDWITDRDILLETLKLSQPSYRTTDIGGAVAKAQKLLETASQETKRIFILTDRDRNGWDEKKFPQQGLDSVAVMILDFSELQEEKNQAMVSDIGVTQEFLTNSRVVRVKARINNLMEQSLRKLPLTLWVKGKKQSEAFLDVPVGAVVEKEFSFPHMGHGPVDGYVEISDDGLSADNRRHFTFQPDRKIKVLVVDGDPHTVAHQSETFYLERALNPFYGSLSDIEPTISTLDELPMRNLRLFSVVILCNVRELPVQYEFKLEEFVVRGGALLVTLGDKIDQKFYNEKMGNLLPVRFEALHQSVKPGEPFQLSMELANHPVLKLFKGKIRKEMQRIKFNAFYKVRVREGQKPGIPMVFKNGLPAVVESEFGKGKVVLFVSSIDRDWNDFPIQPTFLPWVQRWVKYSAYNLESIVWQDLLVGQPLVLDEEMQEKLYLETPGGKIRLLERQDGKREVFYRPGGYRIYSAAAQPASRNSSMDPALPEKVSTLPTDAKKIGGFTVNVDTHESDSWKISKANIRKILSGAGVVTITDFASRESDKESNGTPLATPLLLLMTVALFWEGWHVRRE